VTTEPPAAPAVATVGLDDLDGSGPIYVDEASLTGRTACTYQ
jgi:hypothetical protein